MNNDKYRNRFAWKDNWKPALVAGLDTPCWDCTSHPTWSGYPQITKYGMNTNAHRYLYQELFGMIDSKKIFVRHKCDNNLCINPEHLMLGTHQDNMDDKVLRGRCPRGEQNANAKLTAENVKFIIENAQVTTRDIAKKFNISKSTAHAVRSGKAWKHIHRELKERVDNKTLQL